MTVSENISFYERFANNIPGWRKMTKSELANGYCDADDAKDENGRSNYYSALICAYSYMVPYMQNACKSFTTQLNMQPEDYIDLLTESFDVAFKYRRWRDKSNPLSKDPKAPEKIINRCIYSTQKRWYAYYNKDKRRINAYTYSLEESEEIHGDSAEGLGVEDTSASMEYIRDIIQQYVDKQDFLTAFVLDGICYQDTFNQKVINTKTGLLDENKHPIVYKAVENKFNKKRLLEHLNHPSDQFLDYFVSSYTISDLNSFEKTVEDCNNIDIEALSKKVSKVFSNLKTNQNLLHYLYA